MKGEKRASDGYAARRPGRKLALALAILVHAAFIGVLIWSVRWQSRPPQPVTAELYAPPAKVRVPEPEPRVEPKPEPRPEPKIEPPPPPPPPKAMQQDADIALKARQEQERRQKEKVENEKRERDRKAADERRVVEEKRAAEEKRKADEKKAADARERQERETEALRAQAEREAAQAAAQSAARAKAQAEADARSAAQADWIRRIQAKIRGNVIVPPDLPGNPEAVFEVIQLPTGEIIDVQLRKSSGARAYDEAVQRAILKSSPLPRPDRAEQFQRALMLRFRPRD
jgi:colicin import membrane protein